MTHILENFEKKGKIGKLRVYMGKFRKWHKILCLGCGYLVKPKGLAPDVYVVSHVHFS